MSKLFVANTITDLILGDIDEHFPISRIPVQGTVLGLGTTTALDNGELVFVPNFEAKKTSIYKCNPNNGKTYCLSPTSDLEHFPYVCFTEDVSKEEIKIDVNNLDLSSNSLMNIVEQAINQSQAIADNNVDYYGIYLESTWSSVVLTIASKLCLWQWGRMKKLVSGEMSDNKNNIYASLQHFYCASEEQNIDNMTYLGVAPFWRLIGIYARQPETGLVTAPQPNQNLHIHGISPDTGFGGHLHHEHPISQLKTIHTLSIYPLKEVEIIQSDLTISDVVWLDNELAFTIENKGLLDVSNVNIHIVANNQYNTRISCRIPWLSASDHYRLSVDHSQLKLNQGKNMITIIADPDNLILEAEEENNTVSIEINI